MSPLLLWFAAPEWSQLVKTLLHSLWQGALLASVLALAMRRVVNPHWRYRLSMLALAAIPVAGIVTWAVLKPVTFPPSIATAPAIPATAPITETASLTPSPITKVVLVTNRSPTPSPAQWTAWLALLWIVGSSTMLGRASVKLAGAEHLRRSCRRLENARVTQLLAEARRAVGLAHKVRVAVTDQLTSPAVVGVLVPTLILPLSLVTTLTPEQIRFILLHELAHIRRGDYFANLCQLFVEALLFFNPAVWWISHQVRREREACCDALAIELSGSPADYARTLVHVAESTLHRSAAAAPAFGDKREPSSLADRIQRVLVPGYRPSLRLTWRAMIGAFVLGSVLLVVSAEGTRVAVAQITKPLSKAASDSEMSSHKPGPELANESANSVGDIRSPTYDSVTWTSSAWFTDSERQLQPGIFDGESGWPVVRHSMLPLPAPQLDEPKNAFGRGKLPVLSDLPWVGGLFSTRHPKSSKSDFVQLSQLSTLNEEIRSEHHITDSLRIHFQDSLAGNDLVLAQLPHTGEKLPALENTNRPIQMETTNRFSVGELVTVKLTGTIDRILPHEERIKKDGSITLYLIGDITAAGKTSMELQKEIHDRYVPSYYKTLTVTVSGEEAASLVGRLVPGRQGDFTSLVKARQSLGDTIQPVKSSNTDPGKAGSQTSTNPPAVMISGARPDSRVVYNQTTGESWVTNRGVVRFKDMSVQADSIKLNHKSGWLIANGNVRVEQPNYTNETPQIELNIYSNQPPAQFRATPATGSASTTINASGLLTRRFKVDANTFGKTLESVTTAPVTRTNLTSAVRSFFATLGVELSPPEGVFYNERAGELLVRSTLEDLDVIEAALVVANQDTPQVNIKVRFVEVPKEFGSLRAILGKSTAPTNQSSALTTLPDFTGILTDPQFRVVLRAIDQREGLELLSEGEVTTLSGRQAQIQVVELRTIVNAAALPTLPLPGNIETNAASTNLYQAQVVPFGPVLDVIPTVSADGYTIQMTVIPTVTEFLGYDDPKKVFPPSDPRSKNEALPLPRMRVRQVSTSATVWDGQTLVLGVGNDQLISKQPGGGIQRGQNPDAKDKQLLVFITPTIIDPAGNRLPTSPRINKTGANESFLTSTNLRPFIDVPVY